MENDIASMVNYMNKSALKSKVLQACIDKQQSLINDFKGRIKTLLESQGLGNEEEYDSTTQSHQGQATEEITGLSEALSLANDELKVLYQLQASQQTPQTIVGPGAIVITDKAIFYVSVSIEEILIEGETFIGISTKSPLYQAMKGMNAGGKFMHNRKTYAITDVF